MFAEVALREVTREDVDRIAGWLIDEEISSRWFGHYACGDPVHRGYEPEYMVEATDNEWDRVFRHDPRRFIFSIYNEDDNHIGECQVLSDDAGGAELSLLIGRKDLWHRGYGTSTMMSLLDLVFDHYNLERAWVNVPQDNAPAVGLFKKLGFVQEAAGVPCKRPDGAPLNASILVMDARDYRLPEAVDGQSVAAAPIVTVTGLPGSGSEIIGAEIARMAGARFIDDEFPRLMCERLQCSIAELESVERSFRSTRGRVLRMLLAPWERYDAFSDFHDVGGALWFAGYYDPPDYITEERYLDGLKDVIKELAIEGNVVLHGRGSHLFIPANVEGLHVFVTASKGLRVKRLSAQHGLSLKNAERLLKHEERASLYMCRHLLGADLLDMSPYHLTVNLDSLSYESAARSVVGALDTLTPASPREVRSLSLSL